MTQEEDWEEKALKLIQILGWLPASYNEPLKTGEIVWPHGCGARPAVVLGEMNPEEKQKALAAVRSLGIVPIADSFKYHYKMLVD